MEAHGRNALTLAKRNSVKGIDDVMAFSEEGHTYFLHKTRYTGPSTTVLVENAFSGDPFDAPVIIARYLASWRKKSSSKYHKVVKSLSDREAKREILKLWRQANEYGTELHAAAEYLLNGEKHVVPKHIQIEYGYKNL